MHSDRVEHTRQIAPPFQANYASAIVRFFAARRRGDVDGMVEAFGVLYASAAPQVQQRFMDALRRWLEKRGVRVDAGLFDPVGAVEALVSEYCENVRSIYEEFVGDDEKRRRCIEKARDTLTPLFLLLVRLVGESGGIFVQRVELHGGL